MSMIHEAENTAHHQTVDVAPSITVVIPALDEEAAVGEQVRALLDHPGLRALPIGRVVVVDNGSSDGTAGAARAAGAGVVSESRRGYGAACLAGVLAASEADIVLLMDADGSDDLDGAVQILRLIIDDEADLAMGSRSRGRSQPGALSSQQRLGNAIAVVLMRLLYRVSVSDVGPMRAIRRDALLSLRMGEMTYGWSTEMLVKSARAGYRVAEVPVDYHCRRGGQSKVSGTIRGTVGAGWSMLKTILRHARWQPDPAIQERRLRSETVGSR